MLPDREITYSTRLRTLRECLWQQAIIQSVNCGDVDYDSMYRLIVSRTDLTPTEAGNLDTRELRVVYGKMIDGVTDSIRLSLLADQLEQPDADLAPDTTDNQPQADNTP